MPIRLKTPLQETFILSKTDKEFGCEGDPTTVTIRQCRQGEHEMRDTIFMRATQVWKSSATSLGIDEPELRVKQDWSFSMLRRMEARLTMCACNIVDEEDHDLFRFKDGKLDMSENEFNRAWAKLPIITANEISEAVLRVNKDWNTPLGS